MIPRKTDVVRVSGQVLMAQAVVHRPDITVADYISMAGGYGARADEERSCCSNQMLPSHHGVGCDGKPGRRNSRPAESGYQMVQTAADIMDIIYKVAVSAAVALDL